VATGRIPIDGRNIFKVGIQLLGVVTIFSWSGFFSLIVFVILDRFRLLRVPADTERAGLDNTKHGGPAYPYFQMNELPWSSVREGIPCGKDLWILYNNANLQVHKDKTQALLEFVSV
jgi:hypothetical protein